jgi:hypothetical protein
MVPVVVTRWSLVERTNNMNKIATRADFYWLLSFLMWIVWVLYEVNENVQ